MRLGEEDRAELNDELRHARKLMGGSVKKEMQKETNKMLRELRRQLKILRGDADLEELREAHEEIARLEKYARLLVKSKEEEE